MLEYKGYNIKGDGTFGMKGIYPIGPGSVPLELRGTFTNEGTAMKAIDRFVQINEVVEVQEIEPEFVQEATNVFVQEDKVETDGETNITS